MKKFSLIVFFSFFFLTGFCQLKSSFKSIRFINGDSLDFSQQDGSVYLNQTTGQFRFRENGVWKGLGSGGGMSIDSARIYDSLGVLRDSVDDISNYVHGLSQDFWPLSGNFSTSGDQTVTLGGNFRLDGANSIAIDNNQAFMQGANGLKVLSVSDNFLFGLSIYQDFATYQGFIIDSVGTNFGSYPALTAINNNPNRPGLQIYNSGVMTDSSATNKRYVDTHLGGETFTPPTAGNDGQSVRWNDTGGEWEYYTPGSGGGVSEAYVAESIDTARTYADDNFWPLSGNFSTSGAQTVTMNGTFQADNGASQFRLGSTVGAFRWESGSNSTGFFFSDNETWFGNGGLASNAPRIQITNNVNRIQISSPVAGFVGIQYLDDYSDNYIDRSLVDKGYSDSYISGALTDSAPTEAEINAATGSTPSGVGAGRQFSIKDTDGSGLVYKVVSDGTSWYYFTGTAAL